MQKSNQLQCDNLGLLISRIKNKMRKRMNDKLKSYNLTAEQRAILLLLCHKGAMIQSQLCDLTSMEPSNLSITLKRLENKNYIEKIDHPDDSRAYLVRATQRSQNIANELLQLSATSNEGLFNNIDDDNLRIMCETLKKIDQNLKDLG